MPPSPKLAWFSQGKDLLSPSDIKSPVKPGLGSCERGWAKIHTSFCRPGAVCEALAVLQASQALSRGTGCPCHLKM